MLPVHRDNISALEFNEFSLLDEPIGSAWHGALLDYLQARYKVVLRCTELLDPVERPFIISGCLAVWLHLDEPVPAFLPGQFGGESDLDRFVGVDEAIADDMDLSNIPKPETLFSILTSHFPDAVAISLIAGAIIVEFPEVRQKAWVDKLESLPWAFKDIPHILKYSNGPLANADFKQLEAPNPRSLDINAMGKVLVPSSQVKPMDQFYVDSFVTGRQFLSCVGCRVLGKARGQDFLRNRQESPPDGPYVVLHQGIYATNQPEILGTPKLRAGICGSVLVRARRANEKSSCLEDGEICGNMRTDLAMNDSTGATFYCFADPMDILIDNE